MGTDELRTTYVAKVIAEKGKIYFTDSNNDLYHTNIFVKTGFMINKNKIIYPVGFTINSLILVPILTVLPNPTLVFNGFALFCYILSFLVIYMIFLRLGLNAFVSTVGAAIFSLTNYNLAMYVSYYPDFLLTLLVLIFIYIVICFNKNQNKYYLYLLITLSSFLLSYKITMYPILVTFLPLYLLFLIKEKKITKMIFILSICFFIISFIVFNYPQYYHN